MEGYCNIAWNVQTSSAQHMSMDDALLGVSSHRDLSPIASPDLRLSVTCRQSHCAGQGIEAQARCQLLALALAAIEEQLAALPEAAVDGTAQQWRDLTGALLASCSVAAARAWLGYAPAELQEQAAMLVTRCQPGDHTHHIAVRHLSDGFSIVASALVLQC